MTIPAHKPIPQAVVEAQHDLLPVTTLTVGSVGSSDLDLTLTATWSNSVAPPPFARRVYAGGSGVLYVQRIGDSAMQAYTVPAGGYLDGVFVGLGGSSTGTTATLIVLEY